MPASLDPPLTDEQHQAVRRFRRGEALRINAFAGTGKTTTLLAMGRSDARRGVYLCFNRRLAEEARERFPRHVHCSTIHALAHRAVRQQMPSSGKLDQQLSAAVLGRLTRIEPFFGSVSRFDARQMQHLVWQTLRTFCYSQDYDIQPTHVPETFAMRLMPPEERRELTDRLVAGAHAIWLRIIDPRDTTPFSHDAYLKYWALCRPTVEGDYILLDEAQDTNPVVLGVLAAQSCQIVFVGDRYQQIYEWRGAVNAMEAELARHTTYLTRSFRFGDLIAAHANRVLAKLGEPRQVTGAGAPSRGLQPGDRRAILSRTNAALLEELTQQLRAGERPRLEGGVEDLRALLRGLHDLEQGRPSSHPELFGLRSWKALEAFIQTDEGRGLAGLVGLVRRYGFRELFAVLDKVERFTDNHTITLSTLHKAKGREWDHVRLLDDFRVSSRTTNGRKSPLSDEELRINYVALTRAKSLIHFSDRFGLWLYGP